MLFKDFPPHQCRRSFRSRRWEIKYMCNVNTSRHWAFTAHPWNDDKESLQLSCEISRYMNMSLSKSAWRCEKKSLFFFYERVCMHGEWKEIFHWKLFENPSNSPFPHELNRNLILYVSSNLSWIVEMNIKKILRFS